MDLSSVGLSVGFSVRIQATTQKGVLRHVLSMTKSPKCVRINTHIRGFSFSIHTHIHACMHTYIHTHTYIYIHVYVYIHVHVHASRYDFNNI